MPHSSFGSFAYGSKIVLHTSGHRDTKVGGLSSLADYSSEIIECTPENQRQNCRRIRATQIKHIYEMPQKEYGSHKQKLRLITIGSIELK